MPFLRGTFYNSVLNTLAVEASPRHAAAQGADKKYLVFKCGVQVRTQPPIPVTVPSLFPAPFVDSQSDGMSVHDQVEMHSFLIRQSSFHRQL